MIVPKRICLYAKDVQNITGKKEKAARNLLHRIREQFGKPSTGLVTVEEFCSYTGLKEEEVRRCMVD